MAVFPVRRGNSRAVAPRRLNLALMEIFAFSDHWALPAHRENLDYEIDGTVVIVNDNATFAEAGIIG